MSQKLQLLKIAYAQADRASLLKYDCGCLCGNACCKSDSLGNSTVSGMSLLPGEKELCTFDKATTEWTQDGDILICSSRCERSLRPFMCRIFPFYVKLSDGHRHTRISLVHDPRAFNMCPVSLRKKGTRVNVYFLRHTKRAVRILLRDSDFKNEFIKHSAFADSLYELYGKMFK